MSASPPRSNDESQIRAQLDSWAAALRAKDVDCILTHYAPDAVVADLAPPLWNRGAATLRENFAGWFPTWDGPIGFEARDVEVAVGGELAFARGSHRHHGTKTDGSRPDLWVRATVCFRKIEGRWKVVHEHVSVPFYMDGSLRAAVDLKP